MKDVKLRLADFGVSFATRSKARDVGGALHRIVRPTHGELVVDFAGVLVVSYSFADEFLGEVIDVDHDLGHTAGVAFVNCTPDVADVFISTAERRSRLGPPLVTATPAEDKPAISTAG